MSIYCFNAPETCKSQCHIKKMGRIRGTGPPCKPGGSEHRAALQHCLGAYGLRGVYGGTLPAAGTGSTACSTALRDPFERAVSGWFYDGHHPGSDYFRVGWPPVDGFVDES